MKQKIFLKYIVLLLKNTKLNESALLLDSYSCDEYNKGYIKNYRALYITLFIHVMFPIISPFSLEGHPPLAPGSWPSTQGLAQEYDCRTTFSPASTALLMTSNTLAARLEGIFPGCLLSSHLSQQFLVIRRCQRFATTAASGCLRLEKAF